LNKIISPACRLELHLVQTGEVDVTSESVNSFFTDMFLRRTVYVSSGKAKIDQIDFEGRKKVVLGCNQGRSVNSKIEKQVVKFQIVVNVACPMYFLKDVQNLNTNGAHLFLGKVIVSLSEKLIKADAILRHHNEAH